MGSSIPMGFIIMVIPISLPGIGVEQVAFLVLFKIFTVMETTMGQTVITAFQLGLLCWGVVGAVFYIQRKRLHLNRVSV